MCVCGERESRERERGRVRESENERVRESENERVREGEREYVCMSWGISVVAERKQELHLTALAATVGSDRDD